MDSSFTTSVRKGMRGKKAQARAGTRTNNKKKKKNGRDRRRSKAGSSGKNSGGGGGEKGGAKDDGEPVSKSAEQAAADFFANWLTTSETSKASGLADWPVLPGLLLLVLSSSPVHRAHRRLYARILQKDPNCLVKLAVSPEKHFLMEFEDSMDFMAGVKTSMQAVMRDAATGVDPGKKYQAFTTNLTTFCLCMMRMELDDEDLAAVKMQLAEHADVAEHLEPQHRDGIRKFASCAMTGLLQLGWDGVYKTLKGLKDAKVLTKLFTMTVTVKGWEDSNRPTLWALILKPRANSTSSRPLKGGCSVTPARAMEIMCFFKDRGVPLNTVLSDGTTLMEHVLYMTARNPAFKRVVRWLKNNGFGDPEGAQPAQPAQHRETLEHEKPGTAAAVRGGRGRGRSA